MPPPRRMRRRLIATLSATALGWTVALAVSGLVSARNEIEDVERLTRLRADLLYGSIQELRRWIGGHGGIYVATGEDVRPDPLLSGHPERDIRSPSGRELTLLNSPAFLRLVFEDFEAADGTTVRLVGSEPINPANRPDAWEAEALGRLDAGAGEVASLTEIEGRPYLRMVRPITLRAPCQGCHRHLGREVGDIVGAVSVRIDAEAEAAHKRDVVTTIAVSYAIICGLGLGFIGFAGRRWTGLLDSLERSATHDPLTGLPNRGALVQRLGAEFERAARYRRPLGLLMIDIDHFKSINDTHGHQTGDAVLCRVAGLLGESVRGVDTAGRYGGEEFMIVLPETGKANALRLAERIRAAVERLTIDDAAGRPIRITVSIGAAAYPEDGDAPQSLVSASDAAMYAAKQAGRNRVRAKTAG